MTNPRKAALLSGSAKTAITKQLPASSQVPGAAPVLEYEKQPDGRMKIVGVSGHVSEKEQEALLLALELKALQQQAAIDRLSAAKAKRTRKTQRSNT